MSDRPLRRIASVLVTVVAVLVLAAFVVQAVPALVGADASYVVLSGSMDPTISTGDAVIVQQVDPADVEAGDVITFTRGDESTPVTHRVVEVIERENGLAFRTKGDANEDPDPQPVPAANVTGEVWFVIPFIGHVVLFANTTTGLATLVGVPVVLFVLSELWAFTRSSGNDAPATTEAAAAADATATDSAEATAEEGDAEETAVAESGAESTTEEAPTAGADTDADVGAAEEDAGESGITVTPTDLQFSSVGFTALAAYSGYVAFRDPSPLHVAVFAGAAVTVAFVAAVLLFAEDPSTDAAQRPEPDSTARDSQPVPADETVTDGGETADSTAGGDDDDE